MLLFNICVGRVTGIVGCRRSIITKCYFHRHRVSFLYEYFKENCDIALAYDVSFSAFIIQTSNTLQIADGWHRLERKAYFVRFLPECVQKKGRQTPAHFFSDKQTVQLNSCSTLRTQPDAGCVRTAQFLP
ncbi:hypothetical protein, partial [Cohaesibacter celericrescens]|uniref:hypothetical protein n=1 Tax=Cohaesibacter celericrescens TaxID=2067669 RepID=UPI00356744CE